MVNSSELMISNKLQDIDGNIVEIQSITKDTGVGLFPIKITKEMLIDWGFEYKKTDKSDTYTNGTVRVNYVTDGKFSGKTYLVINNNMSFENFEETVPLHRLENILTLLYQQIKRFQINS